MPAPVADALVRALGPLLPAVLPGRRRMIERHLRRVHGSARTEAELRREVRRSFSSYARYWLDSFRVSSQSQEEIESTFTCEGLEHVEVAKAAGGGVILALPHLGGWDVGGVWLGLQGHPLTVVVEPLEPPELFEWFADLRRSFGMTVVPLGPAAGPAVLRTLRSNGVACLLCDRDITGGGVPVEFFGERTTLPGGPVTLALRAGAAILPTAVYFEGRDRHRAVIGPPLELARTGRLRDDVAVGTQQLARALESLIRAAPDQWHLFQPNWPSDHELAG